MMKKHKKRKFILALVILVAVTLIGGRIYLPYYLKDYVNAEIAKLDGYGGQVEDIDVWLIRGAYQIKGTNIYKNNNHKREPFFSADVIDLSLEWRALIHLKVVAEIEIFNMHLNFAKSQTGEGAGWPALVDSLTPFDVNRFEIHGGKVAYNDYSAEPAINLAVDNLNLKTTNLRNVSDKNVALPSDLLLTGNTIGNGKIRIDGKMNIIKNIPDFDMAMNMDEAQLTAFNDYTRHYASLDFENGSIGLYAELASTNGDAVGYVKPILNDVEMIDIDDDGNPLNVLWESVVSAFVTIFQNQSEEQFALRIPLEGKLENPRVNGWAGFLSIFSNAFNKAFEKRDDGTIDIKTLLENETYRDTVD